jgi:hypothetical protein
VGEETFESWQSGAQLAKPDYAFLLLLLDLILIFFLKVFRRNYPSPCCGPDSDRCHHSKVVRVRLQGRDSNSGNRRPLSDIGKQWRKSKICLEVLKMLLSMVGMRNLSHDGWAEHMLCCTSRGISDTVLVISATTEDIKIRCTDSGHGKDWTRL